MGLGPGIHKGTVTFIYFVAIIICTIMSIKTKIIKSLTAHPTIAIFGIGLAITISIGLASGLIQGPQLAHAGFILSE